MKCATPSVDTFLKLFIIDGKYLLIGGRKGEQ